MTSAYLIYATYPDESSARQAARELITKRLAACVNLFPPHRSCYRWEGEVKEECEVALLAKTTQAKADAVVEALRSVHPYTCPCVLAWAVPKGNPAFLKWIASETA